MQFSIFHLNIWEGTFIDRIIDYVQKHDFDVLHLQEVTGGHMSRGGYYFKEPGTKLSHPSNAWVDSYALLKDALPNYHSKQVIVWHYKDSPESYVSNVTFIKKHFEVLKTQIIRHNEIRDVTPDTFEPIDTHPRASLAVLTKINDQELWFINTHLAWGLTPKDADYKIEQAQVLYEYIKSLQEPFILSGDFNVIPDTQVAKMFDTLGRNLTTENSVSNTLNPRTHKAKHLFPPGLAVDYIFTHPDITVKNFSVIEDDLSDHLGFSAILEI